MNEFVEECRSEWKRLGVPDSVADEMAAELEADLAEAEAEGVPAEAVLGSGASEPRSFAAAWATERGVAPRAAPEAYRLPRRSRSAAAIGAFALTAAIGATLVILASPGGQTRLAITAPDGPPSQALALSPDGRTVAVGVDRGLQLWSRESGRLVVRLAPPPPGVASTWIPAADPRIVLVDSGDSGVDIRVVGSVLLAVGLLGVLLLTMFWLWARAGRASTA